MTQEYMDYIEDIVKALEKIEKFTSGMNYEEFVKDERTVDAVLRNFEVIGEAAKNVPEDVKEQHDKLPWREMAGMRDKLIHGYATVDLQIIWKTVTSDIPNLHPKIRDLKQKLAENG